MSETSIENTPPAPPLAGLILAGGRSTRMGEDKAALRYHGAQSQLAHCAALLAPLVDALAIAVGRRVPAELPVGAHVLFDAEADGGPVEGLRSAARFRPEAAWLVLAVDLPLLTAADLADLLAARDPAADATVFGGPADALEPLCALYEPRGLARLEGAVAAGERGLQRLLGTVLRAHVVPGRRDGLFNANDPADRAEALRRLG